MSRITYIPANNGIEGIRGTGTPPTPAPRNNLTIRKPRNYLSRARRQYILEESMISPSSLNNHHCSRSDIEHKIARDADGYILKGTYDVMSCGVESSRSSANRFKEGRNARNDHQNSDGVLNSETCDYMRFGDPIMTSDGNIGYPGNCEHTEEIHPSHVYNYHNRSGDLTIIDTNERRRDLSITEEYCRVHTTYQYHTTYPYILQTSMYPFVASCPQNFEDFTVLTDGYLVSIPHVDTNDFIDFNYAEYGEMSGIYYEAESIAPIPDYQQFGALLNIHDLEIFPSSFIDDVSYCNAVQALEPLNFTSVVPQSDDQRSGDVQQMVYGGIMNDCYHLGTVYPNDSFWETYYSSGGVSDGVVKL